MLSLGIFMTRFVQEKGGISSNEKGLLMHDHLPNEVASSSSLDTSEISHPLERQSRAQYAMHARTWRHRERIVNVFAKSESPALGRRAGKLGMCCIAPMIFVQKENSQSVLLIAAEIECAQRAKRTEQAKYEEN